MDIRYFNCMTTMDKILQVAIKEYADNHFKDDTIGDHACKFIIDDINQEDKTRLVGF